MKHQVFGRKLKRDIKERKALFRGLISSLILQGKIKTTEAKAKAIRGQVDKAVVLAKKTTLAARRQLLGNLGAEVVERLMSEIVPKFSQRGSGFTQIVKIEPRKGDNAPQVLLRWVGLEEAPKEVKPEKQKSGKEKQRTKEKTGKTRSLKVNRGRTSKK